MLTDARARGLPLERDCDVCIVGGGPAGMVMAHRLSGTGQRVVVVESGGLTPSLRMQRLNQAAADGHRDWRLDASRIRMLGGAGNRWGGLCRPLDPLDLESRSWVPRSDWPISADTLAPYHLQAAEALGLSSTSFAYAHWQPQLPDAFDLDDTDFANVVFQSSPFTAFGRDYADRIDTADVETLVNATVTDLRLDDTTDRVGRVEVRTVDGARFVIRPRQVVLAAGAVENARILLAARADRPAGLGNEHDVVGRYFADHLHAPTGHIAASPAAVNRDFYNLQHTGPALVRGGLSPRPEVQRREQLMAIWTAVEPGLYPYGQPFMRWGPNLTVPPERVYRRLSRNKPLHVAGEVAQPAPQSAAAVRYRALAKTVWYGATSVQTRRALRRARAEVRRRDLRIAALHSLYSRSEQVPDPESRVTLDARARDEFGLPRARLDWRIGEADTDNVERTLRLLDATLVERGYGRVIMPSDEWPADIIGGPHHLGTTRMSASPRTGVVDADAKVHSVSNLYVAGSSTFSTGGCANPTFTMIALALRLADRLIAEARQP